MLMKEERTQAANFERKDEKEEAEKKEGEEQSNKKVSITGDTLNITGVKQNTNLIKHTLHYATG